MQNLEDLKIECDLSESDINEEAILKLLPQWPTKVLSVTKRDINGECFEELKLKVGLLTPEDIKAWIKEYQEQNDCRYYIRSTENASGRYVQFKQRLCCHRSHTRTKKKDHSNYFKKKNTNCPASIMVTLRAVKRRYKGKNPENAPDYKMPCEIVLIPKHNHGIHSVEDLRFRKVSNEVHDKLLELYQNGHTPGTALKTLKMDIQLKHENYDEMLADRRFCPGYDYCYRLFKTEFDEKYEPIEFNDEGKQKLIDRLNKYNLETETNSVEILFHESDYVICICSPLMRRVHETVQSASEMVFLDSSGTIDKDRSRIFIMLTDCDFGGLPLGAIITSSESTDIINLGFQLLKNMVGEQIFGGCVDGPTIFLTDDCSAAEAAFQSVWSNSTALLSSFHLLRTVWRWLVKSKNGIEQNDQQKLFQDFKSVLYANTLEECEVQYYVALQNGSRYPHYCKYLKDYWDRRQVWALCYRNNLLSQGNHTNIYSEAAMRLLKEKIFERTKAFKLVQMLDFLLTKFVSYYERRLLDAAHNKCRNNILQKTIKVPPEGLLDRVLVLSDEIILVPSETQTNLFFMVNKDILMCSCVTGRTGKFCEHIDWLCFFSHSEEYFESTSSDLIRQNFYYIATGKQAPSSLLQIPLFKIIYDSVDFPNNAILIPSTSTESVTSPFHTDSEEISLPVTIENAELLTVEQIDEDQIISRGRSLLEQLSQKYLDFINKSPQEAVDELQMLNDNMGKLNTLPGFVSRCASCDQDDDRKAKNDRVPIQSTSIIRRKGQIRGRDSNLHKNHMLIKKLSQSLGIL